MISGHPLPDKPTVILSGYTEPRLYTQPLRDLSDPRASYGHAVVRFAERVLRAPLDPWEEWDVIHAGELDEDGYPRFRQVLNIVARQNGKTHTLRTLTNFWLFVEKHQLVLGVANKFSMSKESWTAALKVARACPALVSQIAKVREANAQECIETVNGARYLISAAGKDAGRGLTIPRAIWDEVRQEHDWDTHSALAPTQAALRDAQMFMISNMGTVHSVVLNDTRKAALAGVDPTLGIFEWSAPEDADPQDVEAWMAANPNLGRRVQVADMAAAAARAVATGGDALSHFKTERLCQQVTLMDPAVDPTAWVLCQDKGTLADYKGGVALAVDVSIDQLHATAVAAVVQDDGRTRVEVLEAWDGPGAGQRMVSEIPTLVERVKPRVMGWLPGGPAASLAPDIKPRPGRVGWPATVEEIRSAVPAVCMSFAELVKSKTLVHSDDPLLNDHVNGASRARRGDTWVFSRSGGHCDALYAAAAASYLAKTLPTAIGYRRFISAP